MFFTKRLLQFFFKLLSYRLNLAGVMFLIGASCAHAGCVELIERNTSPAMHNTCDVQVIVVFESRISSGNRAFCKYHPGSVCGFPMLPNDIVSLGGSGMIGMTFAWKECVGNQYYAAKRDKYGEIKCFSNAPSRSNSGGNGAGTAMTSDQLYAKILGRRFWVQGRNAPVMQARFVSNGELLMGQNGQITDAGRWWVKGNEICTQWKYARNGAVRCSTYRQIGEGRFVSSNDITLWYR